MHGCGIIICMNNNGFFCKTAFSGKITKFTNLEKKPKQAETEPHGPAREPIVRRGRKIACGCYS